MTNSLRPNFAFHAAKGAAAEVAAIVTREKPADTVITAVDGAADAVLVHTKDEKWPERLRSAHPDKIVEVERFDARFRKAGPG